MKSEMGANEIVEEDKKRDKIVGGIKGREPLFGLVPGFELLVKAFDEVVGDVVLKTLN